jgi:hypothetical protein
MLCGVYAAAKQQKFAASIPEISPRTNRHLDLAIAANDTPSFAFLRTNAAMPPYASTPDANVRGTPEIGVTITSGSELNCRDS